MIGILIATHGDFASGLLSAVELIAGKQEKVGTIGLHHEDGIEKILGGNQLQMLITGASAMGAIVLGALSSQFVTVHCSAVIKFGALKMNVQETVFDALFKGILPLAVTLLTLYLLKNRKMKATTVMLILIVIGVVLGGVGFLGVAS